MYGTINLTIAAICIYYLPSALADLEFSCSADATEREGTCGSHLADTISLICGGVFNMPDKRDGPAIRANPWSRFRSIVLGKRDTQRALVDNNEDWKDTVKALDKIKRKNIAKLKKVSLTKRNAFQYISTLRVSGVVCECCVHDCDWFEFSQYCGK
uniref:Insulin-like peptide 2 n=2 Tax=Mizuhopecten yessoensis TaxID=6573 RepID=A0A346GAU2_MIZYE|nr:insulin-like peptide 2 [Mizuhopecten yessoensis]